MAFNLGPRAGEGEINTEVTMNMSKNIIKNHAVNYLPKNTYITCKSDNKYMYRLNKISPPRLTMLPSPKSHRLQNKKPTPGMKSPLLNQ